jgi:hypothetical protein
MTFMPYDYDGSGNEIEVRNGSVYVGIRGLEWYQCGEYMNEWNRTIDVEIPREQVLQAAEEIRE